MSFRGEKHSTGLSPSLNIWDTSWKVRSNSCKEMITGMSELATRGGLGWRPTMTREPIKNSKMIHEVSWHTQALLEREKLVNFTEESPNKQSNCLRVSQPRNRAGKCDIELQNEYFESDVCGFLMWFGVFQAQFTYSSHFQEYHAFVVWGRQLSPALYGPAFLHSLLRMGLNIFTLKVKQELGVVAKAFHPSTPFGRWQQQVDLWVQG